MEKCFLSIIAGIEPGLRTAGFTPYARDFDRGREAALICGSPPSEPDVRISRIRLSG
jgi:hypothetical protein